MSKFTDNSRDTHIWLTGQEFILPLYLPVLGAETGGSHLGRGQDGDGVGRSSQEFRVVLLGEEQPLGPCHCPQSLQGWMLQEVQSRRIYVPEDITQTEGVGWSQAGTLGSA